jgi:hypothetical protein
MVLETTAPEADGQVVWSRLPDAGVKFALRRADDGGKQARSPRRSRSSRNTIARGMPGRSGVTVVTNSYVLFLSHTRLRVHQAPGIPCALALEGKEF